MFFEQGDGPPPGGAPEEVAGFDLSSGREGGETADPALDAYADYLAQLKEGVTDTRGLPEDSPHVKDTAKRVDMSVGSLNGLRQLNALIGKDNKTLTPEDAREIAEKTAELEPAQLDMFIEALHPEDVSPEERKKIVDAIKPAQGKKEDGERKETMTREEQERMQAEVDELRELDERENMYVKLEGLQKLLPNVSKKVQDRISEVQGMWDHYQHKLDHFLNPDEPWSTWSKRAVKLNWFIIKLLFYTILLECSLISKMSSKQRR